MMYMSDLACVAKSSKMPSLLMPCSSQSCTQRQSLQTCLCLQEVHSRCILTLSQKLEPIWLPHCPTCKVMISLGMAPPYQPPDPALWHWQALSHLNATWACAIPVLTFRSYMATDFAKFDQANFQCPCSWRINKQQHRCVCSCISCVWVSKNAARVSQLFCK